MFSKIFQSVAYTVGSVVGIHLLAQGVSACSQSVPTAYRDVVGERKPKPKIQSKAAKEKAAKKKRAAKTKARSNGKSAAATA